MYCVQNNKEVYGFVTPYEFYTVDKRGLLAGDLTRVRHGETIQFVLNVP
jgi:hypothetical protein